MRFAGICECMAIEALAGLGCRVGFKCLIIRMHFTAIRRGRHQHASTGYWCGNILYRINAVHRCVLYLTCVSKLNSMHCKRHTLYLAMVVPRPYVRSGAYGFQVSQCFETFNEMQLVTINITN
jgi:hypothetical protein